MPAIQSFGYETGHNPKVLVLGSIPGVASLEAAQYYAHPRNAFWSIMASYFSFSVDEPYPIRLQTLLANGVALWDVLKRCEREGSLDSAIKRESIEANAIGDFLKAFPSINTVLLNGGKATTEFKRHFGNVSWYKDITIISLPSTSPAYAGMSLADKKKRWHSALDKVFSLERE